MEAEKGNGPRFGSSGLVIVARYLIGLDASNDHRDWYGISPGSQMFPEGDP